jgi:hypothetical protein
VSPEGRIRRGGALSGAAVLCASATFAFASCANAAPIPRQFDLVCKGEMRTQKETTSFTKRLSVDLDQALFCLDGCWHLAEANSTRIAYHYRPEVADRDHEAGRYRRVSVSTAGPFEQEEDLTVDLRTGMFQRSYVYDVGDRVSLHHEEHYTGRCTLARFTAHKRSNAAQ